MKTDEQLIQMNYDELRTEANLAMDYWQKVIAFRDFKKEMPDIEQFVVSLLEKQMVSAKNIASAITGEDE